MSALNQRHPDALFPVAVHPFGEVRARDLAAEDALAWLMPDKRGGDLPARGSAVLLQNQLRISPADAEFFQQYGTHPAIETLLRELGPEQIR